MFQICWARKSIIVLGIAKPEVTLGVQIRTPFGLSPKDSAFRGTAERPQIFKHDYVLQKLSVRRSFLRVQIRTPFVRSLEMALQTLAQIGV